MCRTRYVITKNDIVTSTFFQWPTYLFFSPEASHFFGIRYKTVPVARGISLWPRALEQGPFSFIPRAAGGRCCCQTEDKPPEGSAVALPSPTLTPLTQPTLPSFLHLLSPT